MRLGRAKLREPREVRGLRRAIPTLALIAFALVVVASALVAVTSLPAETGPPRFQSAQLAKVRIPGPCDRGATTPFTPTTVDIDDVGQDFPIQLRPRDGGDVPGVPAVSATHTVALDAPGPRPGSKRGLVRLNAHTWPNGAALGNAMLARFDVGDVLTLRDGDTKVCFRVTRRVEVDGYSTYEPFYVLDGPSEFAFIVCSGRRLGPGNWDKRTIWFGKPIGDVRAKPSLATSG